MSKENKASKSWKKIAWIVLIVLQSVANIYLFFKGDVYVGQEWCSAIAYQSNKIISYMFILNIPFVFLVLNFLFEEKYKYITIVSSLEIVIMSVLLGVYTLPPQNIISTIFVESTQKCSGLLWSILYWLDGMKPISYLILLAFCIWGAHYIESKIGIYLYLSSLCAVELLIMVSFSLSFIIMEAIYIAIVIATLYMFPFAKGIGKGGKKLFDGLTFYKDKKEWIALMIGILAMLLFIWISKVENINYVVSFLYHTQTIGNFALIFLCMFILAMAVNAGAAKLFTVNTIVGRIAVICITYAGILVLMLISGKLTMGEGINRITGFAQSVANHSDTWVGTVLYIVFFVIIVALLIMAFLLFHNIFAYFMMFNIFGILIYTLIDCCFAGGMLRFGGVKFLILLTILLSTMISMLSMGYSNVFKKKKS